MLENRKTLYVSLIFLILLMSLPILFAVLNLESEMLYPFYSLFSIFPVLLIPNILVLVIISYLKESSMITKSKKIFKINILLSVITIIGIVLFSLFLAGWGEFSDVLLAAMIFALPVIGIIYIVGIALLVTGFVIAKMNR